MSDDEHEEEDDELEILLSQEWLAQVPLQAIFALAVAIDTRPLYLSA